HVLSTPPAFVLSQDQTLRESLSKLGASAGFWLFRVRDVPPDMTSADSTTLRPVDPKIHCRWHKTR
ncbi:MAG: hypothetical protein WCN97_02785, partial [Thermoleophilia bacterium]